MRRGPAPWWGLVLVAAIGCRRNPPAPAVAAPRRPDAGAPKVAKKVTREETPEPPTQRAVELSQVRLVERALCRSTGCCVIGVEDAGTDQRGRALLVAQTTVDGKDCLIPGRPAPKKKAASEEPDDRCRLLDHALVILDKSKVRGSYTLSSECEYGGPINYHLDDVINVDSKTHTFEHTHVANKGLTMWTNAVTIGLDPPRAIEWSQTDPYDITINWDLLRHVGKWVVPEEEAPTTAPATPPPDADAEPGEEGEDGPPGIAVSALAVPKLALPAAFTGGGWKTTGLGSCGVLVDGADNGYTLHGEANARDATLRVVASNDGVLFVEVTDDKWTGPSRSWVKDDHLELWLETDHSADAKPTGTAVQWGIRIADGSTFPAYGNPAPLTGVEVARRGSVARVKLPLPPAVGEKRFALVYSDGDDGKTQERLIATTQLIRGRGDTLVSPWAVDPADASCAMKGRTLAVVRPAPPRDKPLGDLERELE